MKKSYRVRWTSAAEKDLEEIVSFIARDKPGTALKIFNAIRAQSATLKQYPHRGRCLPEFQYEQALSFREPIIPPWRLVYRIKDKEVQVVAFLDSRRNLDEILFERLTRNIL